MCQKRRMYKTRRRKIGTFLSKPVIISVAVLAVVGVIAGVLISNQAQTAKVCSTGRVNSTSFIKTNHLLDLTDGFSVLPTKDGGYLLMGDSLPAEGMAAPQPFIVKANANGQPAWSRWFSSQSAALGEMSSRHIGRLVAETADGNIITAIDVVDFVDEETKEIYGDILLTKLNKKGTPFWSVMLGDYSVDRPRKLWALPDGGVLLLARFLETGHGSDPADLSAITTYSVLIKVDKNGKVLATKKFAWDAVDMERLSDGGFIALANISVTKIEQPKNILGPEVAPHALPTVIRLDNNWQVAWAKSLEMIPSEINSVFSYSGGSPTIGKTVIRLAGGDFRAVQPAPDGGFLVFGFTNQILTQGLLGSAKISMTELSLRPFVAVKVDAAGSYQWNRKLTVNLATGLSANDFQVTRTADDHFVFLKEVARDSANPLSVNNDLGLIKTDADLNPLWVKQIEAERSLYGYGLQPTADRGVALAASMITTKEHSVLGSMEPYKEATLIKVDVNGEVNGCATISSHPEATVEDQSSFLVMQNMVVTGAQEGATNINKKVPEKITMAKNTARDICLYQKKSVAPTCSYLTSNTSGAELPKAKTWAVINYENTTAVAAVGDKNKSIHEELLPILNQVFNNQVKLKDSEKSMWLTYIFARQATRTDVEAVQKQLEGMGYKVDESEGGRLFVSRVGRTLHMTFNIQNSMMGKLEVLF